MDFLPVARGEYPLALCLLRITLTTGDLRVWIQNQGFSTLLPFSLRDVDPMSQMQINPHFFFFFPGHSILFRCSGYRSSIQSWPYGGDA